MNNLQGRTEEELSALRDSIKRKGNNSYYYGHAPRSIDSLPAPEVWDGNEEPKLLAVSSAPSSSSKSALPIVTLEYSYADDKNNVKLYIEFPEADTLRDDQIRLECEGKSFSFTIEDTEKKKLHQIKIELYSSIESSSYKSKKDKFIITLKKLVEGTWHKLKA